MPPAAFVYTELQQSMPFHAVSWRDLSDEVNQSPGLMEKTWLSGLRDNSIGGFHAFDSVDAAWSHVTTSLPSLARSLGVAHTARVFDATTVQEASLGLNSPHYGTPLTAAPGAFVYTELQVSVAFDDAPWRTRNPVLQQQAGLIAKTWLSGLRTNTLGGFYAFDSVETAWAYALISVPKTATALNAALYTRVFDACPTEEASRYLKSPYYP